jgi:hypothetical protein
VGQINTSVSFADATPALMPLTSSTASFADLFIFQFPAINGVLNSVSFHNF